MLKLIFFSVLLFGGTVFTDAQSTFIVQSYNENYVIAFKKEMDSNYAPLEIFHTNWANELEKLSLINKLLAFEGDERLCGIEIKGYGPGGSEIYMGEDQYYSIQIQALFLINQIFFKEPFTYATYPVLISKKYHAGIVRGKTVDIAFRHYKKWFKKVKRIGWNEAQKQKIYPLDKAPNRIGWL